MSIEDFEHTMMQTSMFIDELICSKKIKTIYNLSTPDRIKISRKILDDMDKELVQEIIEQESVIITEIIKQKNSTYLSINRFLEEEVFGLYVNAVNEYIDDKREVFIGDAENSGEFNYVKYVNEMAAGIGLC